MPGNCRDQQKRPSCSAQLASGPSPSSCWLFAGSQNASGAAGQSAPAPPPAGQGKLIIYGDMALFQPPGHPDNCILRNRFKRGEPVAGGCSSLIQPLRSVKSPAQLVVHLDVAGSRSTSRSLPRD